MLQKYIKTSDMDLLREGYNEYISAIASPPLPDVPGLETVRDSMLAANPNLRVPDLWEIVDNRFVREALR